MKIASAVMCFDRPQYLDPVIKSFESADESDQIDWFFFQDGAVNQVSGKVYGSYNDLIMVKHLIEDTSLPVKQYIRREHNISPAQQRYHIYHLLEDYDLLYVFDDDMVIGKHYLTLLRRMANQFPDHVGLLYTNEVNKLNNNNLKKVKQIKEARLWGHYMWKNNWLKFREDHENYYQAIKDNDWFSLKRGSRLKLSKEFPALGDDVVINKLCRRHGIYKLAPVISRAKYIGKFGTVAYKLDNYWKKKNMDKQREQITFNYDAEEWEFKKV
jgi:hypothetical protein